MVYIQLDFPCCRRFKFLGNNAKKSNIVQEFAAEAAEKELNLSHYKLLNKKKIMVMY